MEISFASQKLKKQLEDARLMQKAFGELAKPLMRRLAVLAAADVLADVPTGPPDVCHVLTGDRDGQISVRLSANWRLIFVPDHDPLPLTTAGGMDFAAISAITILGVVDYH